MPSSKLFTRDFCLLFTANLLVTAVYFLLVTTMARYATLTYGSSESLAGLSASVFLLGAVAARPFAGRYVTSFGLKRSCVVSLTFMLLITLLYFFTSNSLVFLIVVRVLHGITFGISTTAMPAIVVADMPKEDMGRGTGYYMLSTTLGTAVGPLAGLLLAGGYDYQFLFMMCTLMAAVSLLAVIAVRGGKRMKGARPQQKFALSQFIERKTWKISAFIFFAGFAYSSVNAFLNSYSIERGLEFFAPFAFMAYGLTLIVTRPLAGKIMDKRGNNVVLYPSLIALAVGLVLCAFAVNPAMIIAVGVFMALGFGTSMSAGQAVATKLVKPEETALTISTFYLFVDCGIGVGAYALGFLVAPFGFSGMYLAAAGIALFAFLYYFVVHGRKKNEGQSNG